ncbi:C-3',4' desaturase CrtD [Prochlorococcus marinus]|uniref:C-3',4' desaturase CrtD n=1 Tax=Prochlorococcus marinus XMU1408 TaxID=2213228 RepID=A0A318R0B7_PROMR|nr:C-3',4' desaturase CrtD [Prochlorococcus marinus]MBW3042786.1 C-3',4' desaturase CrtD [Prochlorococcus marinus str. XMU1408]PYE00613.1 C-3',4' desaturase CrtD [Prochlorococcus marinus XMU1408]
MSEESIIVVGGGIAGLTGAALLAKEGYSVTLIEAHTQLGGCAGTFQRGPYTFDVGATQVAGLEKGGIHHRLFNFLDVPIPEATILDPGCSVVLGDGTEPINLWHDPLRWEKERQQQFPGSDPFWFLCSQIHKSNWEFVDRDPILPVRNFWDLSQLIRAIRPSNLLTGVLSKLTIADLLRITGCHRDRRLRRFLDLQLKLYSQEPASRTAALYGATVLQMAQSPRGLWHLHGSMQILSELLKNSFLRDGGNLLIAHRVTRIFSKKDTNTFDVSLIDRRNKLIQINATDIVFSLPPQSLLDLIPIDGGLSKGYRESINKLPQPSGALVFYGALIRSDLPDNCPAHIQIFDEHFGSIFISISMEDDQRAPIGMATLIASIFVDIDQWSHLESQSYISKKNIAAKQIIAILNNKFDLRETSWTHKELSTPRSFERWTGRPGGIVGGLGQHPSQFGPFGLPSRTPLKGLWLCGDSIYPGEGTAGVSQSAMMVVRQLMERKGRHLNIPVFR